MDVQGFIELLNSKYIGQQFQIIPSYSFNTLPPMPFSTWEVTEPPIETMTNLDGTTYDPVLKEVEDRAKFYEQAPIRFKVYSYNKAGAFDYANQLLRGIKFNWRHEILREKYGIINCERAGELPEKLDEQYLQCYIVECTIDYENIVSRVTPELETVTITGDINLEIQMNEEV